MLIFALFTFAIVSFLFAPSSFLSSGGFGYRCLNSGPRSVGVILDKTDNGNNAHSTIGDDDGTKRHKIMGFVGIQTWFGPIVRKQCLRKTWMPYNSQDLQCLAFFKAAYALFDSEFYVKADEDIL
ncbi:hypothetical protein Golob_015975, partial [Gossypium lobatum]|nr:hypothetical protein [Gossypium lobatum]